MRIGSDGLISPEYWQKNDSRINILHRNFASYRGVITKETIIAWLNQFENDEHAEIGLKLLENVDYYDQVKVHTLLRTMKRLIEDYVQSQGEATIQIRFCGFGYAGTSGPAILRDYRDANNTSSDHFQDQYISMNDVRDLGIRMGEDYVPYYFIMIDDIVGTGTQAKGIFELFLEQVPDNVSLILAPVIIPVSTAEALEREFPVKVISPKYLDDRDKIFSERNQIFSSEEREVLKSYCERAGSMVEGFGSSQLIVVFHTKVPNNSISLLWCENENWRGLFPRRS